MHSYIVTGGTTDQRSDHINALLKEHTVSSYDVIAVIPEPTSIGIAKIRAIGPRLSLRPIGGATHAVVMRAAHTMTTEAQNAFLKTLEEPPGEAVIYLETDQPDALLPTILSRCQTLSLSGGSDRVSPCPSDSKESMQMVKTIEQLLSISVGERLKYIDMMIKTRDDALAFVTLAIQALQPHFLTRRDPVNDAISPELTPTIITKLLRSLLTARTQILGNVTPKLALDAVFLSLF